ncbi:MAG: methyltransferase [Gammaproteobacteria bacterium]|nr:methyltransferase [Gammaproteobacteria bacterium]
MRLESFYNAVKSAISIRNEEEIISQAAIKQCLSDLSIIFQDSETEDILKMTRMTILFEGFYQFIPSDSELKKVLLFVRLQRWEKHFGVPSVAFLLSYETQIENTKDYFISNANVDMPWLQCNLKSTKDKMNDVIVDDNALNNVVMPEQQEETGKFLKTYNLSGGFTTTPCDPYSLQYIEHAKSLAKKGGRVLEIGAAFGAASLQVLAHGVEMFCNDIEAKNLAVIRNRYIQEIKNTATGDEKNLVLVPGAFPDELTALPKSSFDAILICRVLHFFSGEKIEQSFALIKSLLKPGGKVYIICETPYLKNWKNFIPEFEKRVAANIKWPGEISDPALYESSGRAPSLPKFVHWITKDVIDSALNRNNFNVIESSYIDRREQFPDDLLLDGRESVGVVAGLTRC